MDAVEFLKEKNRMCSYYKEDCNEGCPAFTLSNCCYPKDDEIKLIIDIVEKWRQEHPKRTFLQDFLEKHPKAPLTIDKNPSFCPYHCGYTKSTVYKDCEDCIECWNRPMEE